MPDVTILLDCPVEIGLHRARSKGSPPDRFESENVAFYQRVRSTYLQIARLEPGRMHTVNSSSSPEVARVQIAAILDDWVSRKHP